MPATETVTPLHGGLVSLFIWLGRSQKEGEGQHCCKEGTQDEIEEQFHALREARIFVAVYLVDRIELTSDRLNLVIPGRHRLR